MRFVVITGMSGSGKSTALKMLEDAGFYCVDNLPVSLIEKFVELLDNQSGEIGKVALGLDVRAGQSFEDATEVLQHIRENGYSLEILFMDADEKSLIKRYKESRRVHPLAQNGRIEEGVRREQEVLARIRRQADYVIDTSKLLTRQLRQELERIFVNNEEYESLMVTVLSFGFKYGIPADADLVFDVRFLPNPFYIEELKNKTGNEKEVQEYVLGFEETGEFLKKMSDMLDFLIPNYIREGKNRLIIGIGCTGGRHRSVTIANELYAEMKKSGNYGVNLYHRDVSETGLRGVQREW